MLPPQLVQIPPQLLLVLLSTSNLLFIAAAAARINAQLQARKGIQHVDVPPIQSSASPPPAMPSNSSGGNRTSSTPAPALDGEMYVADGDYIQDIEVNDLRNRYLLTKGSTQKMVNTFLTSQLMFPALRTRLPAGRPYAAPSWRGYHAYMHDSSHANPLVCSC